MAIRREKSGKKKILFTILVGFVLVSSIIGFTFSAIPNLGTQNTGNLEYNGIEFFPIQNGIATEIDGQLIDFTYFPDELGGVETGNIITTLTSARVVYTTSDPNSTIAPAISGAEFDIGRVLEARHNSFVDIAFTSENPYGKSVITCNDASPVVPVIFFNFTNMTTNISDERSCTTISLESESDLSRIRDRVVYELIGAMP